LPLFTAEEAARFQRAAPGERLRILLGARRRFLRSLPQEGADPAVVMIQRQVDMLPSMRLERAAAAGRRLVLDVDDAVWTTRGAHGHPLAFLKCSGHKLRVLAGRADQVIAGNEVLAEWLSRHSDNVAIVPSLVDPIAVPIRVHREGPRLRLGWIGSPASAPHLHSLADALARAQRALPELELELLVVGGPAPVIEQVRTIAWPWDERREADALSTIDIGLMPLEDTPFARGKCAYKALQYMSAGVPVIADDVGVSATVLGNGGGGFVATSRSEWIDALVRLGRDPDLRAMLGRQGRQRVEESYSLKRWAPELARLLTG
jgi:glycosyltransferase involved in cell wall biosynthesis